MIIENFFSIMIDLVMIMGNLILASRGPKSQKGQKSTMTKLNLLYPIFYDTLGLGAGV